MLKDEIKARNEAIAKVIGWFQELNQPETWFEIRYGLKYVAFSTYREQFNELPFDKNWNFLMGAKDAIEKLDNGMYGVVITKNQCQITNLSNGEIVKSFVCEKGDAGSSASLIATYTAISDFAMWYIAPKPNVELFIKNPELDGKAPEAI